MDTTTPTAMLMPGIFGFDLLADLALQLLELGLDVVARDLAVERATGAVVMASCSLGLAP